jgi:hypothetical protein
MSRVAKAWEDRTGKQLRFDNLDSITFQTSRHDIVSDNSDFNAYLSRVRSKMLGGVRGGGESSTHVDDSDIDIEDEMSDEDDEVTEKRLRKVNIDDERTDLSLPDDERGSIITIDGEGNVTGGAQTKSKWYSDGTASTVDERIRRMFMSNRKYGGADSDDDSDEDSEIDPLSDSDVDEESLEVPGETTSGVDIDEFIDVDEVPSVDESTSDNKLTNDEPDDSDVCNIVDFIEPADNIADNISDETTDEIDDRPTRRDEGIGKRYYN